MDKKALDDIESRLLEVNKIVEKLDASIRVAAFDFLKPYVLGSTIKVIKDDGDKHHHTGEPESSPTDLAGLVEKFGSNEKPSDNARLLSAWWFSQYGGVPFTTKWIEDTAASTGLTVPAHLNMTFRQLAVKGKALYQPLGKGGLVQPTVVGEQFLKTTYHVKKGTQKPPTDAAGTK